MLDNDSPRISARGFVGPSAGVKGKNIMRYQSLLDLISGFRDETSRFTGGLILINMGFVRGLRWRPEFGHGGFEMGSRRGKMGSEMGVTDA